MATIRQIDDSTYALDARGSSMILEQINGGWRMKTRNAASRVWSLGGESWKDFDNLTAVEAHYKSWKGITSLVASPDGHPH